MRVSFNSDNADSVFRLTARLVSRCSRILSLSSLSCLANWLAPVESGRVMRPEPLSAVEVNVIRTSPLFVL